MGRRVDADSDGVEEAGELVTLVQAGISSINLNIQAMNGNVNGNSIVASTTFT